MKKVLFIWVLTLVIGCVKKNNIPKGVLSQNQMRNIMWDLILADSYVTDYLMRDTTLDQNKESILLYEQVFKLHNTDKASFKKSLSFYQSRPDLLKVITDSLRVNEKVVMENRSDGVKSISDTSGRNQFKDSVMRELKKAKKPAN